MWRRSVIARPEQMTYARTRHELGNHLAWKVPQAGRLPRSSAQRSPGTELHAGMNGAGWMAAFTAAGAFYATHRDPIIPV